MKAEQCTKHIPTCTYVPRAEAQIVHAWMHSSPHQYYYVAVFVLQTNSSHNSIHIQKTLYQRIPISE